jgi:ABC-type cobalamin/Fe3+-siderophores transport system ATPase subunit
MTSRTQKEKKIKRLRLPNELLPLPNKDKEFHETWNDRRNPLNFPHPFRMCLLGPPGVGKSTTVKNIILRSKPVFEEVFILHCDPGSTKEYDDIGGIFLDTIPNPESWEGKVKTLVIIDDMELKSLPKEQMKNLDRLVGYVSTHKNISVCVCSQDPFNVPSIVRRCANIFVLWKGRDLDSMSATARKSGMPGKEMKTIFSQLMSGHRDSLWIDMTVNSPYPLRRNGFESITKTEEGSETHKFIESLDKFEVD